MFGIFKKKRADEQETKGHLEEKPPEVSCPICSVRVSKDKLDKHEKDHFTLVIDTRETGEGDAPFRNDSNRVDTIAYEVRTSFEKTDCGGRFMTNTFIAHAVAKIASMFPKGAQIQCVPTEYVTGGLSSFTGTADGSFLVRILIVITI